MKLHGTLKEPFSFKQNGGNTKMYKQDITRSKCAKFTPAYLNGVQYEPETNSNTRGFVSRLVFQFPLTKKHFAQFTNIAFLIMTTIIVSQFICFVCSLHI